jgi:hypothetical protein
MGSLGTQVCFMTAHIATAAMYAPHAAIKRHDVGECGPAEPTSKVSRCARSQTLNGQGLRQPAAVFSAGPAVA